MLFSKVPISLIPKTFLTSNEYPQNTITSNDRLFACPIIYTDIYSQHYFVHRHLQASNDHSDRLIGTPYLSIIARNEQQK